MKSKRLLLMLLMALLAPWAANAQTVTIGTGTSAHNSAPIANYYNYSLAEMLFTSAEIGSTDVNTILSIGFEGAAASSKTYGITVYMKNVDATSFSAASDYIQVSASDVVYTGSIKPASGWNTIELATPFAYDNTKSLLVVVNKTSGGYDSNTSIWKYTSMSSPYMMLYGQNDSNPGVYNPTTLTSLATSSERPNVQLTFGTPPTCFAPQNLTCTEYTATSATLTWQRHASGTETAWVLQYSTDNTFATGVQSVNVSTTPSTQLTGLTAETTYFARVRPDCDENLWSDVCEFKPTAAQTVTIGDGTSTGYYLPVNTFYYYSLTQQIYTAEEITAAGGTAGTISSISFYHAYSGTATMNGIKAYLLNTDKAAFANNTDMVPVTESDKVWEGNITLNGAGWVKIDFTTPFDYDGGNLIVCMYYPTYEYPGSSYVFRYTTTTYYSSVYYYSDSSNPDLNTINTYGGSKEYKQHHNNIQLGIIPTSTPKPRNLQVTEKTSESATLTWEAPANATPMSYLYHYKKATDAYFNQPIDNGHNLSVTLNELAANTEYNFGVYANYSEGMSDYAEITFTTEATCLVPAGLAVTDMVATWNAGTASKWNLQYKRSADATWTAVNGLTAASYDFNTLTLDANKDYDVQVQADCGNNDLSEWSETVTFRTPCGIETIDATHSWSEGFESYNEGTSTYSGVAVTEIECWERVLVNSTTNSPFVYRNFQEAASTGLASLELKTGTSPVMVALPEFSAPIVNLNVAFNYNRSTTSYTYTAELGYISNVDDATTFVKLFDIPTPVARSAGHSAYSQDLYEAAAAANAPEGSRVAIRFASSYEYSSYPPSWNFDDFVVSYVSDCHKPTGLAVTDGSITPNGATVTWEGNNDSYKVMIGQENLIINANFEGNQIPANFTNSATYPWTTATGGANNSGHCIIPGNQGVHNSDSDLTLAVNLAAPATISFWAKISSESSDYGRFLVDDTQKLNISGTTSWVKYEYELTAGSHTLIWRYHKDGSVNTGDDCFYVDDIVISAGVASWTEYTTTAKTCTFDNLTPNRTYQVKVKGVCGSEETPETAPESFTTDVSCPAPTGLVIAQDYPTAHGVSFTWDYEDGEVFQFALPVGNVTDPSEVNFNSTWYAGEDFPMWNNLSADTDWSFWLRKKCGDNEYSDPVSVNFHTLEACPAPTNFDVDDITNHTATLSWEGTSNEYQVSYRTAAYVDGLEERFDNSGLPTGWICYSGAVDGVLDGTVTLTSGPGWGTNSYALGEYNIKANIYSTGCYKWVVSPEFTFNGEAVEFDVALTDYGNSDPIENVGNQDDDRFVVLVYADDEWHILREWNNSGSAYVYDEIPHTGTHVSIDLSLYSGKTIRVAFYGESTESGGDNDLHIDNVKSGTDVPAGEMQYASNLTEETVTLSNLLAERKYEAWLIGDCGSEGISTEVGPITFKTDIACPAPTALTHANVKSNQVDLSWTNGGAENWVVAYKKTADENFTEKNVTTADVTIEGSTVKYTLTGLAEETAYTVKVRDNCEPTYTGDGQSEWTSTVSFTTMSACEVENVTISDITHFTANVSWNGESADGFTVKYRTAEQIDGIDESFNTTPNGWEIKNGLLSDIMNGGGFTSSTQWDFATYNGVFDSHARINIYGSGSSERHGWLITPEFTLSAGAALSFDLALTAYSGTNVPAPATNGTDDKFVVLITTDNEATWTILRQWDNDEATTGADYAVYNDITCSATGEQVNIDLNAYAGQDVRIAFYGESTVSNADNNLHIDNVVIGTPLAPGTEIDVPATDSPANLSSLEAGKKYDVKVVPNCDETFASDWVQFTTVSPSEKWFITEGNWGTAANWEPTGVPTIEQNVTLKANATIESTCVAEAKSINGTGTGTDAKTLTIKDGGKLKHLNSNVRATVEKVIRPYSTNYSAENNNSDYYLIANPLTSNVTPDAENNHLLSGNYDLYNWSYSSNDGKEWRNYDASNFSLSSGAYGYLYANEAGATLTYTGTINSYTSYKNRSCSVASNPDNYDFPGWYLLGNPYMYDAYLANAGSNGTALPYIKMNTTGDGFVNVDAGTPIAPMEGFFYQGVTGATSAYVVTNAPTVQSKAKLNMNLRRNNKQLDNAILVFGGDQQLGKMTFRANSSKIFMPVEGKDYAITSVEGQVGEVPVSFVPESNGTYSLSFTSEEVSFSYLHLIDNMTGNDVNLLETPSYTFDARTSDYESRFRLVFATGSSATDDTFGFVNASGNFCIFGIEGEATVQVIDVLGHVLSSEQFSGSYERQLNVAPGVYMIRLIQGNDIRVQKMVVR